MTQLSKQEVCQLLHISSSTLWRRIKAGTYTCTRDGDGQFSSLSFTYSDIGLPEPQSDSIPMPMIAEKNSEPQRNAPPSKIANYEDADELPADDFADRYKAGEATDSSGNRIDGGNDQYAAGASLLGPIATYDGAPVSRTGTAHMDARLLSDYVDPNFPPLIPANTARLAAGYSPEQYAADLQAWRRSGGGRSESELEQQVRRSKQNIARSFPHK